MKYIALILVLVFVNIVNAQQDSTQSAQEYKTIFSKNGDDTKISGFGSLNLDFGSIDKTFGLMIGGEGALLIDTKFYVGIYGRGLATMPQYDYNDNIKSVFNIQQRVAFGHGGLLIGYIINPTEPLHFGFSARIGGGATGLVYFYDDYNQQTHAKIPEGSYESIFAFAPEAFVEMNLTNWFKIKCSVGYQYISDVSVEAPMLKDGKFVSNGNNSYVMEEVYSTKNYKTPIVSLGFVFGWFK